MKIEGSWKLNGGEIGESDRKRVKEEQERKKDKERERTNLAYNNHIQNVHSTVEIRMNCNNLFFFFV